MIDLTDIDACAGDGGRGAVSFRREKGVPKGGPNGGDGGRGGSIHLVGRTALSTLNAFRFTHRFTAPRGENGRGKEQYGKGGQDVEVEVPCGTVVYRRDGDELRTVGELLEDGQRMLIARGGKGGRGNMHFTTATRQAPYIAEDGEDGEDLHYRLELKLLADVGIIGKPNAGKSTFLSAATAARPKIAPYPFTTTEPVLGVVSVGWATFVMAEIPGLVEGAHLGIGLGDEFLRHATRTRVLIHLVDGSAEDVSQAIKDVNAELDAYGAGLPDKAQLIVVNKIDLPEVEERKAEIAKSLRWNKSPLLFVSAAAHIGIDPVVVKAAEILSQTKPPEPLPEPEEVHAGAHGHGERVRVENGKYIVLDDRAVRLVLGSDLRRWAGRAQVKSHLNRIGVSRALEQAGIKQGDTVVFGDLELEW